MADTPTKSPADVMRAKGANGPKRQMFKTTCINCGKPAEVPFEPTADRPAYCRECFLKMRQANKPKRPPQQKQPQGSGDISRKLDVLSSKLDRLIQLLEPKPKPKTEAPIAAVSEEKPKKTTKKVAKKKATKKKP